MIAVTMVIRCSRSIRFLLSCRSYDGEVSFLGIKESEDKTRELIDEIQCRQG